MADQSAIITHSYIAIPVDLVNRYAGNIEKFVIPEIETYNGKYHTKAIPLYKRVVMDIYKNGNKQVYVLFPRHCGRDLLDANFLITPKFSVRPYPDLDDNLIFPEPNPEFSLLPLQKSMVDVTMNQYLNEHNRNYGKASCLIQAETGSGKTFLALGVLTELVKRHKKMRAIWIVLNSMLQDQAIRDINKVYSSVRICTNIHNMIEFENAHICVIIINSAIKLQNSSFKNFGLVIYDEIPNFVSESRRGIFWNAKASYTIGLTADIAARPDKLDDIYIAHLGPIIYEDSICDALVEAGEIEMSTVKFNVNYKFEKYFTPSDHRELVWNKDHDSRQFLPSIKKCLVDDMQRNSRLINGVLKLVLYGHEGVILMVHHREHVILLTELMIREMKTHENIKIRQLLTHRMISGDKGGKDIMVDSAGVANDKRSKENTDCVEFRNTKHKEPSIVIATYAYASVGLSLIHLTALVLGVPPHGVKKRQVVGRILRINKEHPEKNNIPRMIWMLRDTLQYMDQHWINTGRYFISREFNAL
jgi:superfamily II DNA or RNA helicase